MATKTHVESYSISVSRGHHEDRWLAGKGGYSRVWVEDPPTLHHVSVQIDVEKLAGILGQKAVKSKSGKSRALSGLIVVKDMSRKGA